MADLLHLIDKLAVGEGLSHDEFVTLIHSRTPETAAYLAEKAVVKRQEIYGNTVYIRGLIEVSNICKNDCLYCGIRAGNPIATATASPRRTFSRPAKRATSWASAPLSSRAVRTATSPTGGSHPFSPPSSRLTPTAP